MTLSDADRQMLAAVMSEIERRGLTNKLKTDTRQTVERKNKFRVDSAGYFVKRDGTRYNPTDDQEIFINDDSRYCAFFGSRGSGKTGAGAQKALKRIAQGESGAVLNPDFENFKISTWPELREWIPWEMVIPRHKERARAGWVPLVPFKLAFINGVEVICKGLKDEDSSRGPNINWLWYDEGTRDKTGVSWSNAIAGVRIGKSPQAWMTATPRGKLHWSYKFFVEQNIDPEVLKLFAEDGGGRKLINYYRTQTIKNKDNLDPGFLAGLMAAYVKGSALYRQEVEGEFVSEEGSLGNRNWFNGHILAEPPATVHSRLRYWDLAATEKKQIPGRGENDPDESVGSLFSWDGQIKFCLENQHGGCWKYEELLDNICTIARVDGPYIKIVLEEEPGSGGKNQVAAISNYIRDNVGVQWKVEGQKPGGERVLMANAWFAEASNGRIDLVRGEWNEIFLSQLDGFPGTEHDDRVTSVSGARQAIAPFKTWKNIEFLNL